MLGNKFGCFRRSKDTCQKIRNARLGVSRPDVSKALTGIKRSDETKEKLRLLARKRVGEKNPMFGKALSDEHREKISKARRDLFGERQTVNKQVRRYWKVGRWVRQVFTRDKFECRSCGARNGAGRGATVKLEAHHKVLLSEIVGARSFREVVKDSALYDVGNGLTLCRTCHRKEHGRAA